MGELAAGINIELTISTLNDVLGRQICVLFIK